MLKGKVNIFQNLTKPPLLPDITLSECSLPVNFYGLDQLRCGDRARWSLILSASMTVRLDTRWNGQTALSWREFVEIQQKSVSIHTFGCSFQWRPQKFCVTNFHWNFMPSYEISYEMAQFQFQACCCYSMAFARNLNVANDRQHARKCSCMAQTRTTRVVL